MPDQPGDGDPGRPSPEDGPGIPPVPPVPPVGQDGVPAPDDTDDGAAQDPEHASPDQDGHSPPGEKNSAEEAEEKEKEEYGKGYDDLRLVQQRVYNNFYASVDASGAAFGFGGTSSSRTGLAPGVVEPETVDEALRCYVRPQPCFDEALGKLAVGSLVVLTGQDNCGRGAGALALLREVAGEGAPLRSLSPANALAELATTTAITAGQGYVIRDYVGETNVAAVQAYEIGRLSEELRRKNAFLVITADHTTLRRLALSDHCVQWHSPDPSELFHRCREQLPHVDIDPESEKELLESVAEQRRPADVVAAAAALLHSPRKAIETLRDGDSKIVQDWFAAKPSAEDLLPMAALAFLEGVPERNFEDACAKFFARMRTWELNGETAVAESEPVATLPEPGAGLEQSRARWKERAVGLVHVERRPGPGQDAARSERRLVFTSPRIRDLVIGELHGLYGYKLWYPLRQWLGDLSRTPDLDTRTEVARGTAVLARYALNEVEEHLLGAWAEGLMSQRVTAALTLQFMCETDHLAPQALGIVLDWTTGAPAVPSPPPWR
ncbi:MULTISPECIES: hypothetical protein [Streptomyces]|uniref:Uncharacterized protein n=2 Tax=Streptomyces TaxID=1883 RepID=A0ABV9IQ58_9ACTN